MASSQKKCLGRKSNGGHMELSIFLAKAMGLYLIIISLPMLFNYLYIIAAVDDLLQNKASYFSLSITILILGILLVCAHNIWTLDWRVVITLLAWSTFIKGIMWFYYPLTLKKISKAILSTKLYIISGLICLTLGLFLVYHGFFVQPI